MICASAHGDNATPANPAAINVVVMFIYQPPYNVDTDDRGVASNSRDSHSNTVDDA